MSIRNTKKSTTKQVTTPGVDYKLARSDIFYFLQFINYESELYKLPSTLTSRPNLIFYTENAVNKIILDYSSANSSDKIYLKSFFAGLNQTNGITLSSGSYLEEAKGLEADLSSNITFSEFKNDYLFGVVNSTTNKNVSSDLYMADYFIDTPQLSSSVALGQNTTTKKTALISPIIGANSLHGLGVYPGDVIELVNSNSENSGQRFEVSECLVLNNKQMLVLKQDAVSENLTGSASIVNLYLKQLGLLSLTLNLTDTNLGCCLKGDMKSLNNTKYQCQLRTGTFVTTC